MSARQTTKPPDEAGGEQLNFGDYLRERENLVSRRAALNEEASQLRRSIGGRARKHGYRLAEALTAKVGKGTWQSAEALEALTHATEQLQQWIDARGDAVTAPAKAAWPQAAAQGTA